MSTTQGNPPIDHTIGAGDTFYELAKAYYGDGNQWQRIADANPGVDANNLQIGQTIHIP
ncbi:MAG: LysM peptidoglycan-binding domain-containing protein [Nostoc sp.]